MPETKRAPPVERTAKVFAPFEPMSKALKSRQTNEPLSVAFAKRPAAKLKSPPAVLLLPPGTVASLPVALLPNPPPVAEKSPAAELPRPPATRGASAPLVLPAAADRAQTAGDAVLGTRDPPPAMVAPTTPTETMLPT
jgi:hypothetical protein